jgi:transposase
MTFIAALRCDRLDAPLVIDGPINGESFAAYVEQVLRPNPEGRRHRRARQSRLSQGGPPSVS